VRLGYLEKIGVLMQRKNQRGDQEIRKKQTTNQRKDVEKINPI